MPKVITPDEVVVRKKDSIPQEVFDAFNDLIAQEWNGNSSHILQKDVVALASSKLPEADRTKIYNNHWLDVEAIYRDAGWEVEYDKPGYNESYEASFTFSRKRRR